LKVWRRNILDKYTVRISSKASRDIRNIYQHIANEKLSPENAKGQVDRIKKAILGLDTFPQSHQKRTIGTYAGKCYRQLIVDNYIAIFEIKEESKIVRVVTVQHQLRNI
jgi:toxin ParE1/3/4